MSLKKNFFLLASSVALVSLYQKKAQCSQTEGRDWLQPSSFPKRTPPPTHGLRVAERYGVAKISQLTDDPKDPFPTQLPRVITEGDPNNREHYISIQIILPDHIQEKLAELVRNATEDWDPKYHKRIKSVNYHLTLGGGLVDAWKLNSKRGKVIEDDIRELVVSRTRELINNWVAKNEGKEKPKIRWKEVTISKADINCEMVGNESMIDLYNYIKEHTNQKWEFYEKSTTLVRYLLPRPPPPSSAPSATTQFQKDTDGAKAIIRGYLERLENFPVDLHKDMPLEAEIDTVWITNGDYVADSYDIVEAFSLTKRPASTQSPAPSSASTKT